MQQPTQAVGFRLPLKWRHSAAEMRATLAHEAERKDEHGRWPPESRKQT